MVWAVRRMHQVLLRKLHCLETHKPDGHIYYTVPIGDRLKYTTKMSSGWGKDIPKYIPSRMAQQLHISTKLLKQIYDCSKGYNDYLTELRRQGLA